MFSHLNPMRNSGVFFLAILFLTPVLLFPSFLPRWTLVVALGLLALTALLRCLATKRLIGHTPADWPLLFLFLLLSVGLWASADRSVTLVRTYALVANLALFWAVASLVQTRWLRWTGWALLAAGFVLAAFFLLGTQFVAAKLPFIHRDIYGLLPGGLRPFWNPEGFNANLTGGLLGLFLMPAVILTLAGEGWLQRGLGLVVSSLLAVMVLLAQSRGALIGVAVALPVVTILLNRRWGWFWLILLIGGGVFAYTQGVHLSLQSTIDASETQGLNTLTDRVEIWSRALYLVQDFSFTGVGMGMFEPTVKLLYPTFQIGPDVVFKHTHNIYLQAAAEMGIPGLISYLALYLIMGFLLVQRALDRGAGLYRVVALGLLGALIVYLVHGFFEVITYATRSAVVVWGLFGLMVAVSTAEGEPVEECSDKR